MNKSKETFVVLGICELLDILYPNGWLEFQIPYEQQCKDVRAYCEANNFMLYERPRESYFERSAIIEAREAGYDGVVLSDLS